jgi:hypothetical protein
LYNTLINDTNRRFPRVLLLYWLLISVLFAIAAGVVFVRGNVLHQGYPYNTFLFDPADRFADFTLYEPRLQHFGSPAMFSHKGFALRHSFNYPPALIIVLRGWYNLPGYPLLLFRITLGLAALGFAIAFDRSLVRRGINPITAHLFVFTVLVTSFPLIFLFDRLNFEGLVWIVIALGLLALAHRRPWLAATLFAIATAIKISPAVLFALLLSRKTWRQLLYGISLAACLTVVCLWLIGPTIGAALHAILYEFKLFHLVYLYLGRGLEMGFQHSLFSIVNQVMLAGGWHTVDLMTRANDMYSYIVPIVGLWLYFRKIRYLPLLNQILALTTCTILLPWWSGDYTLVHLYVPWAMLVLWIVDHSSSADPPEPRRMLWFLAPFAIVFTPQSYLIFNHIDWAGQIKAVALLVLLISTVRMPLEARQPAAGALAEPSPDPA